MSRQFPNELHIGQKVVVRIDPTAHPIEALVTHIDRSEGVIHVNPIGYQTRWAARPRAIANLEGQFLQFDVDNGQFFFAARRKLA